MKEKFAWDGILGLPAMKQANTIIPFHQSYVRYSTNKGKMFLKYNRRILRRNHESNTRGTMRAPKNNIIVIVEISNLEKKLEIDDLIDPCITNCMLEAAVVKELEKKFR